ncbi:MAG: DUF4833 domain-containing protein [Proteobacteria bacterium]|nr:DUF4833 domain-containing protein [Pseudomonadota bacterium]NIS69327.1 DUF4833 domain-containing protein [Pseudomonadota bacterium]
MRRALCFGVVLFATIFWFGNDVARGEGQQLFYIERSINGNIVRYDVDTTEEGNLVGTSPVFAYWILENGERAELSRIQRKYAYGIESQERLGFNRYRIILSAMAEREITVQRTDEGYRAFVLIDGREGILERIYVECVEGLSGFPKVIYVELFGQDGQSARPVTERILPHRQS